jgi:hypothetical protein
MLHRGACDLVPGASSPWTFLNVDSGVPTSMCVTELPSRSNRSVLSA